MSVIITLEMQGDPARLEQHAGENRDAMQAIVDAAKGHGLIAHRFYGSDDGRILVVDEWPDRESFERFFGEQQPAIGPLMEAVGVTGQPQPSFWRKLETHDDYGWQG